MNLLNATMNKAAEAAGIAIASEADNCHYSEAALQEMVSVGSHGLWVDGGPLHGEVQATERVVRLAAARYGSHDGIWAFSPFADFGSWVAVRSGSRR